jgi:hypothetical protein
MKVYDKVDGAKSRIMRRITQPGREKSRPTPSRGEGEAWRRRAKAKLKDSLADSYPSKI